MASPKYQIRLEQSIYNKLMKYRTEFIKRVLRNIAEKKDSESFITIKVLKSDLK